MSDNRHYDFDFEGFDLDDSEDPFAIFRQRIAEEEQDTPAPTHQPEESSEESPEDKLFAAMRKKHGSKSVSPADSPVADEDETQTGAPPQDDGPSLLEALREQREMRRAARAEKSGKEPKEPKELKEPKERPVRKEKSRPKQKPAEPETEAVVPVTRERAPVTIGLTLHPDEMLVYDSELDEVDYDDPDDLPEARDYMPIRFKRTGRSGLGGGLLYGLFVISVSIVLAVLGWMFTSDVLALNKTDSETVVVISAYEPAEGESALNDDGETIQVDIDEVAATLKNAGIIEYPWLFKLYSRFSSAETKIDPGTYDVSTALDYRAIVTALQFGSDNQEVTRITFPEGYTTAQIFEMLEENGICKQEDLYEAAASYDFDYDFLADIPLGDANRLEGYLFPDTYDFYQGESATVAISRFLNNTESKLTDAMYSEAENLGYSMNDIITIASLIEKEAGNDEERATIAGVIYNRLGDGWMLQLDSTIHYMLTQLGRDSDEITYDDLQIDSPYNTYLYYGLPAGPICNPGLASIQAALEPESNHYWYFYASDGENIFFTSLSDFEAYSNSQTGDGTVTNDTAADTEADTTTNHD